MASGTRSRVDMVAFVSASTHSCLTPVRSSDVGFLPLVDDVVIVWPAADSRLA